MKDENKTNGLEMIEINSKAVPIKAISDLKEINNYIKNDSFAVAYLDYKVLAGRYKNGSFSFYNNEQIKLEFVQRLRIFNNGEELLIWRSKGNLKGRYRKDNDGGKTWAVDNNQVIFGTEAEKLDSYIRLTEDRGTEIIVPAGSLKIDDKKNRMKIKTRNYIGFNEIHQATYVDCRFVGFTFGEENNPVKVQI